VPGDNEGGYRRWIVRVAAPEFSDEAENVTSMSDGEGFECSSLLITTARATA
jgi:hypothetical protein